MKLEFHLPAHCGPEQNLGLTYLGVKFLCGLKGRKGRGYTLMHDVKKVDRERFFSPSPISGHLTDLIANRLR